MNSHRSILTLNLVVSREVCVGTETVHDVLLTIASGRQGTRLTKFIDI